MEKQMTIQDAWALSQCSRFISEHYFCVSKSAGKICPQKSKNLAKWKTDYEVCNIITFDSLETESQVKVGVEVLFLNHLQFS